MAKVSTRTTRAPKGATTAPLDPTADAATLDDTLSYAMHAVGRRPAASAR